MNIKNKALCGVTLLLMCALTVAGQTEKKLEITNNNADAGRLTAAYELALPAIADSQLLLFRSKLEKLKSLNDELELKLDRAPKSANFNKQQLQDEFKSILKEKDQNKRDQRIGEFGDRYEQQFTEQLKAAGIDVAAERRRMASLLGFTSQEISQEAVSNAGRMVAVGTVMEFVDDRPPVEAAPLFYEDTLGAPFTEAKTRGAGSANRNGTLVSDADSPWNLGLRPVQNLAFVGQDLSTRPGARRLRVTVPITNLYVYVTANALWGFAYAEFAINLRVLDGARVVASRRVPVERFAASFVGLNRLNRRLSPITVGCEFERTPTAGAGNYLMIVEFETLAGSNGFADARSYASGIVGPFTVRTY